MKKSCRTMETFDLVIIGAGAAGLSAGIYAARSGLKTLIIEEKLSGGTTADAPTVENYPGFIQIRGAELAEKMTTHCRKTGVTIHELENVTALNLTGEKKTVTTSRSQYEASAVIIATGSHYREIGATGEKEFRGKGVSYCGVCDGPLFKGKNVMVVGGGNSAAVTTLYLSGLATNVTLVHRRETFRCEEAYLKDIKTKTNVEILWNSEVKEIKGNKLVDRVIVYDNKTGETKEIAVNGVFVQVGEAPNSQTAKDSGVETDEHGFIKTDLNQRTNIPGAYAAGDVTNQPVKQVGTAVGQGITAALEAYAYIRRPYYRK
jgi:thioredoxin reductase (NADPH)